MKTKKKIKASEHIKAELDTLFNLNKSKKSALDKISKKIFEEKAKNNIDNIKI